MKNFVEQVLSGEADLEQIDDFVGAWHEGEGEGLELHEFLGLSETEYARWLIKPSTLGSILTERRLASSSAKAS